MKVQTLFKKSLFDYVHVFVCEGVTAHTISVTQAQGQKSGLTMTGLLISSILSHPSFL